MCSFWNDFLANFLSDLIAGVIIATFAGFLLSVWWNRKQQGEEARDRKAKMLTLIKKELEHNLRVLSTRASDDPSILRNDTLERFKDELWNAFSDGGELQWIEDLELLDSIASAYYRIRTVIIIEDMLRQHQARTTMVAPELRNIGIFSGPLKIAEDELLKAVNLSIGIINKALSSEEKKQ